LGETAASPIIAVFRAILESPANASGVIMLGKIRRLILASALLGLAAGGALAAEFETRSRQAIVGRDAALDTGFSARSSESKVEIRIDLPRRKAVVALIDYESHSVTAKSLSAATGRPVTLDRADINRFRALRASIGPAEHRVGDALLSLLELLSEAPTGVVLDLDTRQSQQGRDIESRAFKSLCGQSEATGRYDANGTDHTVPVSGLGCYTKGNECLGRCGDGCGDELEDPPAVQRITQECLNHDLCARDTGDILGACSDEFEAAADGFFFAPDCGSLTGTWKDGQGRAMRLNQDEDQDVAGRLTTNSGECAYRIQAGEHTGRKFELSARRIGDTPGCCRRLIYNGTIRRSCDKAQVEWKDSCGDEDTTSFRR
jgi:hypothetical protein